MEVGTIVPQEKGLTMASSDRKLTATIELDGTPERLWPVLSDTDRTNRLVNLPASEQVAFAPDLTRSIHGHYLGIPVTWQEYPFEWVFEQWFAIERRFDPPVPVTRLVTRTALNPLAGGRTRVEVLVEVTPRNLLGRLGAQPVIGHKMLGDLLRVYRTIGSQLDDVNLPPAPRRRPVLDTVRLKTCAAQLRQAGQPAELIERLVHHLSDSDDPAVLRMRPFALADRWGAARLDVLRLFLFATRGGLLDLEWDIICPNCRGPSLRAGTLADLQNQAHCPSCNIRYDVNFDQSVEVRFSVSPDVRRAEDATYCVGGPGNTRHIMAQLWVPAHQTKELRLRLPQGSYRLRSAQIADQGLIEVREGAPDMLAPIGLKLDQITVPPGELASGAVTLSLSNHADTNVLIIMEQAAWNAQAASAALVTAMAEFRQLFSSEVLAPGLGLSVRNMTFLFSDLKGSTTIYDTLGDAPAYARVRDHFDVMHRIISRHRGALVKTIGDAVMAVFPAVEDGVEAAVEIQREFTAGEIAQGRPALRVKLGLHRGACIAVNANDILDYFGSTVNITARVQNESLGGDIVITPAVYDDEQVRTILQREVAQIESFERELKGVSQAFTLFRLWLTDGVGPERASEPAAAASTG